MKDKGCHLQHVYDKLTHFDSPLGVFGKMFSLKGSNKDWTALK